MLNCQIRMLAIIMSVPNLVVNWPGTMLNMATDNCSYKDLHQQRVNIHYRLSK